MYRIISFLVIISLVSIAIFFYNESHHHEDVPTIQMEGDKIEAQKQNKSS